MSSFPTERQTKDTKGIVGIDQVAKALLPRVRALGFDLERLVTATRLLAARTRNQTQPSAVVSFLSPMLGEISRAGESTSAGIQKLSFVMDEKRMQLSLDDLSRDGQDQWPLRLALLRLPALRSFWERALRRSRFQRLLLALPAAWFHHEGVLPPGAVVPGLRVTSWDAVPADIGLMHVQPLGSPAAIWIKRTTAAGVGLCASYEHSGRRVALRSIEADPSQG